MTEKYIDLEARVKSEVEASIIGEAYVRATLAWLDEHPDQVPGRTIAESELRVVAGRLFARWPDLGVFMGHLQRELSDLGITVVPDPEPTNAERLVEMIRGNGYDIRHNGNRSGSVALALDLDARGVKAPGGDDD